MTTGEQHRIDELATAELGRFGLSDGATAALCNVSENHTYRVDDPGTGSTFALRVHRPGYRDAAQIGSELDWVDALRADGRIRFVDLRAALESAKPGRRLYYLTDSHWNFAGAARQSRLWQSIRPAHFPAAQF